MLQRINELVAHYEYLGSQLADPEVLADHKKIRELSQERSGLEAIVGNYHRLMSVQAALDDARLMLRDEDEDVREFARSEIETLDPEYTEIEYQLKLS
jgi:peptide chain release factor 1